MAEDKSKGSTSVIDRAVEGAKEGFQRGKSAAIRTVKPPMIGDHVVIGSWILLRDNGTRSLFDLQVGGKGTETLYRDDFLSLPCEWRMEGKELLIITHADQRYHHRFNSAAPFGCNGIVTVNGEHDSEFTAYPYRDR